MKNPKRRKFLTAAGSITIPAATAIAQVENSQTSSSLGTPDEDAVHEIPYSVSITNNSQESGAIKLKTTPKYVDGRGFTETYRLEGLNQPNLPQSAMTKTRRNLSNTKPLAKGIHTVEASFKSETDATEARFNEDGIPAAAAIHVIVDIGPEITVERIYK